MRLYFGLLAGMYVLVRACTTLYVCMSCVVWCECVTAPSNRKFCWSLLIWSWVGFFVFFFWLYYCQRKTENARWINARYINYIIARRWKARKRNESRAKVWKPFRGICKRKAKSLQGNEMQNLFHRRSIATQLPIHSTAKFFFFMLRFIFF